MPAIDTEAQFKFLLSCIKHSTQGKVDFTAVSQELGIVSKAAAAKRYERLMKAHDITVNPRVKATTSRGGNGGGDTEDSAAEPKTPASKKRKRAVRAAAKDEDEEEDTPVKKERKNAAPKKEESDDDSKLKGESDGSLLLQATAATATAATCCKGGVGVGAGAGLRVGDVKMEDIPEAFPRRPSADPSRPAKGVDDDYCVIVGERTISASVPPPAPATAPVTDAASCPDHGHDRGHDRRYSHSHSHGEMTTPPNFGYHRDAASFSRCGTNLMLHSQMMNTSASNLALEARRSAHHDATPPPSWEPVSWSVPPHYSAAPPSAEYHCGRQHTWQ